MILEQASVAANRWVRLHYGRNGPGSFDTLMAVDANGNGQALFPTGSCRVSAQSKHWLRRNVDTQFVTGVTPSTLQFDLPNGDAAYDGKVDLLDLSDVLAGFSLPGEPYTAPDAATPYSDVTEDGIVNLLDLSTVLSNYGLTADPPSP